MPLHPVGNTGHAARSVGAQGHTSPKKWDLLFCCLLFGTFCGGQLVLQVTRFHAPMVTDDAYYYFLTARHIVQNHYSSFDGFSLSNGYQPLWMAVLSVQYKLFGESFVLTRLIEYLLGVTTLCVTLPVVRLPNLMLKLIYTAVLYQGFSSIANGGMETSLWACCAALMTFAAAKIGSGDSIRNRSGLALGLAATATIASRIDSAAFALPQLWVAAKTLRRRLTGIALVLACGALYLGLNRHFFGTGLPVSGEIKSLGGMQVNHVLLHQLTNSLLGSRLFIMLVVLYLMTPFAMRVSKNRELRSVQIGLLVGFPIFMVRLLFFSSWVIWPWYMYPLLLACIGTVPPFLIMAEPAMMRAMPYRAWLVVIVLLSILRLGSSFLESTQSPGSYAVNDMMLQKYGGLLGTSRVAMGDRAGEFAYGYAGGVSQLEGLMNDKEYFDVIREKGDVKTLLCRRGVKYLLSYEDDLGNYDRHGVETIRGVLSQYPAPKIEVQRQDEVGRVFDLSKMPSRPGATRDTNVYLYLWKLGCE